MTTDKPKTGHDAETRLAQRSERWDATDEVTFPYQRLPLAAIARALGMLCLVAVLIPFLVFAVPQTVGADHAFVILSGSMEPQLSPGDVVVVADGPSAQVGDVITFTTGGSVPVTHRVVGVEDGQYVTKGDANENADSAPVAPSAVLGRVVFTIPVIGYVILWTNTPIGQIAFVVVPLVLLGVSTLYSWSRDDPTASAATEDGMDDATALAAMFDSIDESPRDPESAATASDAGSSGDGEPTPVHTATVAVAAPDLKLTLVASAVTLGYAAWNVAGEFAAGAPHPISVAVATAGLLGVLFGAWTLLDNRRAAALAEPVAAADGGVELEGEP